MTAPGAIDLNFHGDHSRCVDEGKAYGGAYCLATRKPGPCQGTHRPGTVLTPPTPVKVPAGPSAADAAKIAAMRMQDPAYRAAYLKAEQIAQAAGLGRQGHASIASSMHDYAHALHQHGLAENRAQRAYAAAQQANANATARATAQQASFRAREAAAEARVRVAAARANLHRAAHKAARGTPFPMGGVAMMAGDVLAYALGTDDGGAYALVGQMHLDCGIGEFCRNPLHPGPCKGWKHMLHAVSPGAYHAYERRRVDQANARREARVRHLQGLGRPVPAHLTKPIPYPTGAPTGPAPANFHPPTPGGAAAALPRTSSQIGRDLAARRAPVPPAPPAPPAALGVPRVDVSTQLARADRAGKLDILDKLTAADVAAMDPAEKALVAHHLDVLENSADPKIASRAQAIRAKTSLPSGNPDPASKDRIKAASRAFASPASMSVGKRLDAYEALTPDDVKHISGPGQRALQTDLQALLGQGDPALTKRAGDLHARLFGGTAPSTPSDPAQSIRVAQAIRAVANVSQYADPKRLAAYEQLSRDDIALMSPATRSNVETDLKGLRGLAGRPGQDFISKRAAEVHDRLFGAPATTKAPGTPALQPTGVVGRAPLPANTSAHVQHAAAVAHRTAPGGGIAKRQVEAYAKLSKADYDALPDDTKGRVRADLVVARAKFLDPSKRAEVTKILDRLAPGASSATPTPSSPTAPPHDLKKAQAEALAGMMSALGSPTGAKRAGDAVSRAHDALKPGQKLSEAPGMTALISGLADEVQKRHGVMLTSSPAKSEITKQIADHLDAGKPGLPVHVEGVKDAGAPIAGKASTPGAPGATVPQVAALQQFHAKPIGPSASLHAIDLATLIDGAHLATKPGTPERGELNATLDKIAADPKVPAWTRGYAHILAHPLPTGSGGRVDPSVQAAVEAATEQPGTTGYHPTTAKLSYLFDLSDRQLATLDKPLQDAIRDRRNVAIKNTFLFATTDTAKERAALTVLGGNIPPDADNLKRFHELEPDAQATMRTWFGRVANDAGHSWPQRIDAQARLDATSGITRSPDTQRLLGVIGTQDPLSATAYGLYRNLDRKDFAALPAVYREGVIAHLGVMAQARVHGSAASRAFPFPSEIAARLEDKLPKYPEASQDGRLKFYAALAAGVNKDAMDPRERAESYLNLGNTLIRDLSGTDRRAVLDDAAAIAGDRSAGVDLLDRNALQQMYDKATDKWSKYSQSQQLAITVSEGGYGRSVDARVQAYADLSKADYDALPTVYRDSINDDLATLGTPAAAKLTAKFRPALAGASPAGMPTVSSDPKIQAALDVVYGVHPKAKTTAHQMSTYGALRKAQFDQLNADEKTTLLGDLSYIATTSKGADAGKASKLIDRFTPAGTPAGTVPTQAIIPPASSVSGQHRVADPAGTPGLMTIATDKGRSGDGWTRKADGTTGPWGQYGAAGVMLRHVGDDGKVRYLMIERGPGISDPGKWQFPGGAIDSKETPHQGATRETVEELGFKPGALAGARVHGEHVYSIHGVPSAPGGEWRYTTIAATVPTQLKPDLSTHHARAETSDAKWMTAEEIDQLDKRGKLLSPLAGGKLQQNVMSLFPQPVVTGRPTPRTTRPDRLRPPQPVGPHKPSTGKNLVADKTAIDALRQQVKQARKNFEGKAADARLAAIGAMQGFDDTPTVRSKAEVDRLLATGDYIEVWRGVRGTHAKSAKAINDDLRHGPAYYGNGVFGNGYYFATQKSVANNYSDGSAGSVVRALIPKSALIIKHDDAIAEARKVGTRTSQAKNGRYEPGTLYDEGRYAAAKGMDGIEIVHTSGRLSAMRAGHVAAPGRPAYNWLNRSVLIVQE